MSKILALFKNQLVTGSLIMIIGTGLFSLINYFYQIIVGRWLAPADYGQFVSIASILLIYLLLGIAVQTTSVKHTVILNHQTPQKIWSFFHHLRRDFFLLSLPIFLIVCLISPFLADFFKIKLSALLIINLGLLFIPQMCVNYGILQGLKRFKSLAATLISESIFRLGLGSLLIYLDFSLNGSVAGIILGFLGAFLIGHLLLRFLPRGKNNAKQKLARSEYIYFTKVFFTTASTTLLYTLDVFLIKHYFSEYEAGVYSSIAVLARIIVFGSGAIAGALLPLATEKHHQRASSRSLLKFALAFTVAISVPLILLYYFFPDFILGTLFGPDYLSFAPELWLLSLPMTLVAIENILVIYLLSKQKFKIFLPWTWLGVILMISLTIFYHQTINQVIFNLLLTNLIVLTLIIINFFWARHHQKNQAQVNKFRYILDSHKEAK